MIFAGSPDRCRSRTTLYMPLFERCSTGGMFTPSGVRLTRSARGMMSGYQQIGTGRWRTRIGCITSTVISTTGAVSQSVPNAIRDSAAATASARPCAACWQRMAAAGVECPSLAISSARVALVSAASTAPECRRSWNLRSGRSAASRAL
jgi:hypothetical protein